MIGGRTFGASLKPAWNEQELEDLLIKLKGTAKVYAINHNQDMDDNGELIEEHTHFYIEYNTPRKISTVANLLKVDINFIEIVRSKNSYLRYLTHKDNPNKAQYSDLEVFTNDIAYKDLMLGISLTDRDIADYLVQGRGLELLGIVSASRLRTIQSFLHFENTNKTLQELKAIKQDMTYLVSAVSKVEDFARKLASDTVSGINDLTLGLYAVANELRNAVGSVSAVGIADSSKG